VAALAAVEANPWPGNVRALENAIERSVLLARGPFIEAEDIFGTGAGISITMAAVSAPVVAPTISVRVDPRREPSRAPTRIPSSDPRREAEATALPPPPKLARFESSPRHEAVARPAVLSVVAAPENRASNPAFPRVLPDQGFDLFSAVESYQNNLIKQALLRTGGNKNKAAQLLGLNRTTLVEMIRRRGL
jgi:sigma-54 specific flagellar transcriptional regulator A